MRRTLLKWCEHCCALNFVYMNKHKVNAYLATLIITIAGAGAAALIVKVANQNQYSIVNSSSEAGYSSLKQSILNSNASGVPSPTAK